MDCPVDEVDEVIRRDFESMPSHLFHDRYKDVLEKYLASLATQNPNTTLSRIGSVRSFFSHEASSITLNRLPKPQMAKNEHRFTVAELRKIWMIGDVESRTRLSVALSLGWGVSDFLSLRRMFIDDVLKHVDQDGYAAFDWTRKKTGARTRGLLNPDSVRDLTAYLETVHDGRERLWTCRTSTGVNFWLRSLVKKAGIARNGKIRFHLLRKFVYDTVSSTCGINEAKLLTGKAIPLADATYLHGLEDRLLERYKSFAYPLLQLSQTMDAPSEDITTLKENNVNQQQTISNQQLEIKDMRTRLDATVNAVEAARKEVQDLRAIIPTLIEERLPMLLPLVMKQLSDQGYDARGGTGKWEGGPLDGQPGSFTFLVKGKPKDKDRE